MAKTANAAKPAKAAAGKFQLAAQLYTLRDHCKTVADAAKTFKKVAKMGYRLAQVSGPCGQLPAEDLARLAADSGLQLIGSHISLDDWTTKYAEKLALLKTIGCRYTAVPSLPRERCNSLAAWKQTAKAMNSLGQKLAKDGIVLQYHNHKFEFERFNGKTGLAWLYELTDPKFVQAEIDTAWIARGFEDPARWILAMKGRMDQIHFKDTVIVNNEDKLAEIGNGNLDWAGIVAACKKIGVKHIIVEQDGDWLKNDPFKALEFSYKFLNTKFGLC